jgi:hypothetical protein
VTVTIEGGLVDTKNVGPAVECRGCGRVVRYVTSLGSELLMTVSQPILGEITEDLPIDPDRLVSWVRHQCDGGKR